MTIAQKSRKKYEVKNIFKRQKVEEKEIANSQSQPQNKGNTQKSTAVGYTDEEGMLRIKQQVNTGKTNQ